MGNTNKTKRAGPVTKPALTWINDLLDADPAFRAKVDAEVTAMEIADKLAELRRARKVSQVQLGKMLGVSQSMIAQLEAGNAKNIEVRTLVRYAAALDGSVEFKIRRNRGCPNVMGIASQTAARGGNMAKTTVRFNRAGASKLPNDKPVVYKITTPAGRTNYVGVAQRGRVSERIAEHLGEGRIPGAKVQVEQKSSIKEARATERRIIARSDPKYNRQG